MELSLTPGGRAGRHLLPRARLRLLQPHRLSRAAGDLRDHAHGRRAARADHAAGVDRGAPRRGAAVAACGRSARAACWRSSKARPRSTRSSARRSPRSDGYPHACASPPTGEPETSVHADLHLRGPERRGQAAEGDDRGDRPPTRRCSGSRARASSRPRFASRRSREAAVPLAAPPASRPRRRRARLLDRVRARRAQAADALHAPALDAAGRGPAAPSLDPDPRAAAEAGPAQERSFGRGRGRRGRLDALRRHGEASRGVRPPLLQDGQRRRDRRRARRHPPAARGLHGEGRATEATHHGRDDLPERRHHRSRC